MLQGGGFPNCVGFKGGGGGVPVCPCLFFFCVLGDRTAVALECLAGAAAFL